MAADQEDPREGEPPDQTPGRRAREPIPEFLIGVSAVAAVVLAIWGGIALFG